MYVHIFGVFVNTVKEKSACSFCVAFGLFM